MDLETYFRSLSTELSALQNRVRNFIADAHWQTDGEWKESVVKHFLRRNLSRNIEVGSGFIVHPKFTSKQLDIILYDANVPVLFRDGDLVFLPINAVKAIVEVKTRVTPASLREAVEKLAIMSEQIGEIHIGKKLLGLFVFDDINIPDQSVLEVLREIAGDNHYRVIDLLALGQSKFFRWWECKPGTRAAWQRWHSYYLEQKAPGYFLHNLLEHVCPEINYNPGTWFPPDGKEAHKTGQIDSLRSLGHLNDLIEGSN